MTSFSSDSLGIASIFAVSVGMAIWSASYVPAPPIAQQRASVAIPTIRASRFDPDRLTENQQPPLAVPSLVRSESSRPDNLLVRRRIENAPPGVGDLFWGSRPTAAMIKVSGPSGPDKVSVWRSTGTKLRSAFGLPVTQENYFFRNDWLFAGEMVFDGLDSFQKIKDGIIKTFGPPDFVDNSGNVLEWDWQNPDIHLRISYKEISHLSEMRLERM
jgi:hypothetical protein